MYELYDDNPTEQRKWRSRILAEYPESDYAKIIQNPEALAQHWQPIKRTINGD